MSELSIFTRSRFVTIMGIAEILAYAAKNTIQMYGTDLVTEMSTACEFTLKVPISIRQSLDEAAYFAVIGW